MQHMVDALAGADWFTSSFSNDHNGACVEGARLAEGAMAVRDSKNPHGPVIAVGGGAWTTFVEALNYVKEL
ncbi:DUF397 domain-containing protein [Streptomyces scopuliridis]|uniref:DUF397 domain-containing protein n=1 Tax=Streptomyces scopuliridis TaxID=452529 RepID=UPI0036944A73